MKTSTAYVVPLFLLIFPRVNKFPSPQMWKTFVNSWNRTAKYRIKIARLCNFYYRIMQHDHASVLSFSHVYFVIGYFLRLLSYHACLGDIISHISFSCVSYIIFLYFIVSVYRVYVAVHVVSSIVSWERRIVREKCAKTCACGATRKVVIG